jgi:hypothetical protein
VKHAAFLLQGSSSSSQLHAVLAGHAVAALSSSSMLAASCGLMQYMSSFALQRLGAVEVHQGMVPARQIPMTAALCGAGWLDQRCPGLPSFPPSRRCLLCCLQVIRELLGTEGEGHQQRFVIVVEHDLSVLDYLSDFICCLYGKPGAYGVVTLPFSVREGINIFLAGAQLSPTSGWRGLHYVPQSAGGGGAQLMSREDCDASLLHSL